MKRIILITILLIPLLAGCKKDPDPEPVDEYTFEERARDALYDLMKAVYLWYDKMPVIKLSDYPGPAELLAALRYKTYDNWSQVVDYDAFMAYYAGEFVGHGISMGLDQTGQVRILTIYKNSDLWPKGVRRGWILKKVNGIDIAPIMLSGDGTAWNTAWGASTAGVTNTLLFVKPDAAEVTLTSTKTALTVNTVMADTVFDRSGRKIAYLCFDAYLETSEAELNEAFAYFVDKGATDLIIDLRYNGGGLSDVALQLASLVVDNTYTDKVCVKYKYNALVASDWDKTYNFLTTTSPLGLDKVVFITTRGSASASEYTINSLKPWIDVTLVGDTTYGKPVGSHAWAYPFPSNSVPEPDYEYIYSVIAFKYVNSMNEGDFFGGIPPDVLVNDDITRDFGDTEELSLKAALAVIEGTKAGSAIPYHRTKVFTESPKMLPSLIDKLPKK